MQLFLFFFFLKFCQQADKVIFSECEYNVKRLKECPAVLLLKILFAIAVFCLDHFVVFTACERRKEQKLRHSFYFMKLTIQIFILFLWFDLFQFSLTHVRPPKSIIIYSHCSAPFCPKSLDDSLVFWCFCYFGNLLSGKPSQ